MLWIHPAMQVLATLIGLYAAYLGVERFLSQHLSIPRQFRWNRHVALGEAAIVLWLVGLIGGFAVTRIQWQASFVTDDHYETALAMLPLLLFGGLSGLYMHRSKARRRVLPLLHGLCNLVVVGQALYQFATGWQVIEDFIL